MAAGGACGIRPALRVAVAGKFLRMRSIKDTEVHPEYAPDTSFLAPSEVFVQFCSSRGASISVSGATVAEPSLKIEGKTHCALAPTEPERYFMLRLDAKPDAQRCRLTILRL
jgi:hypothetical protein